MTGKIKHKVFRGVLWSLTEKIGKQGFQFLVMILLARLLLPSDFGLAALASVFFALAASIIDSGFGQAYVQKKTATDADANTLFYTNIFIGLLVYVVFWLIAPYFARFYDDIRLVLLIRVMSLALVINSFKIVQISKLTRQLNFKHKTRATLFALPLAGSLGVITAYLGFGVWSLVIKQLSTNIMIVFFLWNKSKWRPRFIYSFKSLKEMFSFGSWLLLGGLVGKIVDNIFLLSIGKLFPISYLGYYSKAKRFSSLAIQDVSRAITTVTFPVFSRMQGEHIKLASSMIKVIKTDMLFTVPIMITLIVVSEPFVLLLLTDLWLPMVPFMQLLCILGIIYPVNAINQQVLKSQGKSKLIFFLKLFSGALNLLNIIFLFRWGLLIVIAGQILLSFISITIKAYYVGKLTNAGLNQQLWGLKEVLLGGLVSGVIGYIVIYNTDSLFGQLLLGTFFTMGTYLIIQYFFNRTLLLEIVALRKMLSK